VGDRFRLVENYTTTLPAFKVAVIMNLYRPLKTFAAVAICLTAQGGKNNRS
jgi:hypothetical protein